MKKSYFYPVTQAIIAAMEKVISAAMELASMTKKYMKLCSAKDYPK